jgi:hypothetical protein
LYIQSGTLANKHKLMTNLGNQNTHHLQNALSWAVNEWSSVSDSWAAGDQRSASLFQDKVTTGWAVRGKAYGKSIIGAVESHAFDHLVSVLMGKSGITGTGHEVEFVVGSIVSIIQSAGKRADCLTAFGLGAEIHVANVHGCGVEWDLHGFLELDGPKVLEAHTEVFGHGVETRGGWGSRVNES